MEDSLKTEIIIKSVTKIAQQDGIPVFVVKKGDPDSGIILIKIDLLNGKGQLIRRNYSYSLKKNKSIHLFAPLTSIPRIGTKINKINENKNKGIILFFKIEISK